MGKVELIKVRTMALGLIEIILITMAWFFIATCHLVVFILMRLSNRKLPWKFLLIYGIPICATLGCVLTPPDIISSLTIAVPCIILFAVISGCGLLLMNRFSNNLEPSN